MTSATGAWDAEQAVNDLLGFTASDVPRFGTGYSLDDTCGMIGPGELGLIWARSGSGKSTAVLNWIANSPKVPTVCINMEMTARRQVEWLAVMTYEFEAPSRLIDDVLRDPEDPRHAEVVAGLRNMKLRYPNLHFVNPPKAPTVSDMAMAVDSIEDQTGVRPQRVFIDHLGLLAGCRDYESYSKTAGNLHTWAMNDGLSIICIQQTGRGGGDAGRNDGHIPVTLSSGVYAGEHDADWIWGIYRPEKDPKFKKERHQFKNPEDYYEMLDQKDRLRGLVKLQLIKNRPYGELRDEGIELWYEPHNRRLREGA